MAITFEIAGVKDVRVQANDAIKRRQPTGWLEGTPRPQALLLRDLAAPW